MLLTSTGSSRPTGSRWRIHHQVVSPGTFLGQWGSRYAPHASRQLSGEVLRYLKRVRVTPALHWRFDPLYRVLTYQQWADVSLRKNRCQLSETCVFGKQSEPPGHCDLPFPKKSRGRQALLIPRIRSQFAEFPRKVCPVTPRPSQPGYLCQFWVRKYKIPIPKFLFTEPQNQLNSLSLNNLNVLLSLTDLHTSIIAGQNDGSA